MCNCKIIFQHSSSTCHVSATLSQSTSSSVSTNHGQSTHHSHHHQHTHHHQSASGDSSSQLINMPMPLGWYFTHALLLYYFLILFYLHIYSSKSYLFIPFKLLFLFILIF